MTFVKESKIAVPKTKATEKRQLLLRDAPLKDDVEFFIIVKVLVNYCQIYTILFVKEINC
jgi:hypothetical protein